MRFPLIPLGFALAVALGGHRDAHAEKVVLLNGFEPEVLKQWAGRRSAPTWSYLRVVRIGEDGLPTAGGMNGALAKGDATQGDYAMVRRIPNPENPKDHTLNYLRRDTIESIRRIHGTLLNTFGTFRDFYPQDWSGYAKMRFDIKSEGVPLRLRVEIEDSVIVPPLRRVYEVPADRWVTVEFDLAEAGRLREVTLSEDDARRLGVRTLRGRLINLKEMANLRIGIELLEAKAIVRLDNVRLLAAGAEEGETTLPVLTDERPFPVPTALPASEPKPRPDPPGPLNRAPVDWADPVEVEIAVKSGSYGLQLMDVAPLDNDRMLMVVGTTAVLRTVDGGRSWTGLDGARNEPTKVVDHDLNAPGRVAAAVGPDIMALGVAKCSGGATPVDSYSILVRFEGRDWKVQPRGLVDVDVRHCPEHRVRLVGLPGGRVWASWLHYDRFARNLLCARYSDDGGATWRDPTSNGLVDLTTRGRANPYAVTWWLEQPAAPPWEPAQTGGRIGPMDAQPPLETAAWGDHVMCAYVRGGKLTCSFFDGSRWAHAPAGVPGEPAALVHAEGKTVYLATSEGKVYRLEGTKWVEDSPPGGVGKGRLDYPGGSPVRLSVAGRVLMAVWTDGKKILTAQKPLGGSWSAPREIAAEERGVHWLGAPARSVPNFVPVVWSVTRQDPRQPGSERGRFVRVPVTRAG